MAKRMYEDIETPNAKRRDLNEDAETAEKLSPAGVELGKAVEERRLMATSTQTTREDNAGGGLQLPPDLARFMENMMGGPRQPGGGMPPL